MTEKVAAALIDTGGDRQRALDAYCTWLRARTAVAVCPTCRCPALAHYTAGCAACRTCPHRGAMLEVAHRLFTVHRHLAVCRSCGDGAVLRDAATGVYVCSVCDRPRTPTPEGGAGPTGQASLEFTGCDDPPPDTEKVCMLCRVTTVHRPRWRTDKWTLECTVCGGRLARRRTARQRAGRQASNERADQDAPPF